MIRYYVLLIVISTVCSTNCVASFVSKKDTTVFSIDTNHIKTFKTKFGVKPQLKSSTISTRYGTRHNYVKVTSYAPIVPNITLTYKNFDLSFSINATRKLFKNYSYTASKLTDFSFNFYKRKIVYEVVLRKNDAFYTWINTATPNGRYKKTLFDFNQTEYDIGFNVNYVVNAKHFSYKAAFFNSAKQLKSCGSPIFSLVFNSNNQDIGTNNQYAGGRAFFPKLNSTSLQSIENTQIISSTALIPRVGYGYTFVKYNFYLSAVTFGQLWKPAQLWTINNKVDRQRYWQAKTFVHLQSGFNWSKWFAGIAYNNEVGYSSWHDVAIRKLGYNLAFIGGYRIVQYHNPNKNKRCGNK